MRSRRVRRSFFEAASGPSVLGKQSDAPMPMSASILTKLLVRPMKRDLKRLGYDLTGIKAEALANAVRKHSAALRDPRGEYDGDFIKAVMDSIVRDARAAS